MSQSWHNLLFAHWPLAPNVVVDKVPPVFELDLYEGMAWLGIVPFRMTNVAPRGVPALPWLSEFLELNVRTYVRVGGKPGVYFFSLDAASRLAVWAARTWLNLPYHAARMSESANEDGVEYESRRRGADATLSVRYGPVGATYRAPHGSLEYFLTERYCLYHVGHRGRPYRLEIHHPPWPLQAAQATFAANSLAEAAGLPLPDLPPLLHFSKRQDMVAWAPARL
jgi:uncharacterized protein